MAAPTRAAWWTARRTRQYRPPPAGVGPLRPPAHRARHHLLPPVVDRPHTTLHVPGAGHAPALAWACATCACDDQGLIVASPLSVEAITRDLFSPCLSWWPGTLRVPPWPRRSRLTPTRGGRPPSCRSGPRGPGRVAAL